MPPDREAAVIRAMRRRVGGNGFPAVVAALCHCGPACGYTAVVLGPGGRAVETLGPFPTPAAAAEHAAASGLGEVRVVPHRHAAAPP